MHSRCIRGPKVWPVYQAKRQCFENQVSLAATNTSHRRSSDFRADGAVAGLTGIEPTQRGASRDRGHPDIDVRLGKSRELVEN